jgi:hypothetical protein
MADRLDRNFTRIVVAVLLAVLLLGGATQFLPWLTRSRDALTSTPVRTEVAGAQMVALRTGQRACLDDVPLEASTRVAQVTIARAAPGETRLSLETAGGSYRARTTARIPPRQTGQLDIRFSPPRRAAIGVLCVRNAGRGTVALAGTDHPWALTRSTMTVDGEPRARAFSLTLREADRRPLLGRVPQLADRAAALSAVGPWLLWLLIPLLVVGVPACVIVALRLALREPSWPPSAGDGGTPPTRPASGAAPRSGDTARA